MKMWQECSQINFVGIVRVLERCHTQESKMSDLYNLWFFTVLCRSSMRSWADCRRKHMPCSPVIQELMHAYNKLSLPQLNTCTDHRGYSPHSFSQYLYQWINLYLKCSVCPIPWSYIPSCLWIFIFSYKSHVAISLTVKRPLMHSFTEIF